MQLGDKMVSLCCKSDKNAVDGCGVATLSCIDSSTASSDISDPGSPYSSASVCEDIHTSSSCNGTSNPPTSAAGLQQLNAPQNSNKGNPPYQLIPIENRSKWPWSSSAGATLTTSSAAISSTVTISPVATTNKMVTAIPALVPSENGVGQKNLKRTPLPSSQTIAGPKRVRIQSNETKVAYGKKQSAAIFSQQPRPVETIASPQTKITGFFKSQMKPISQLTQNRVLATTKKDLTNMVVRSTEFPTKKRQYKTKDTLKLCEAIQKPVDTDTGLGPNRCLPALDTISKAEEKKLLKKASTARRYARNALMAQQKKPVTIAPRILDSAGNLPRDNRTNQPAVLLTTIRMPSQTMQSQPQSMPNLHSLQAGQPTLSTASTEQLYQLPVMPNLVQIPNLQLPKNTNIMLNTNAGQFRNGAQYFLNGAVIKLQTSDGKTLSTQTSKQFTTSTIGQSVFMSNGLLLNTAMPTMLTPQLASLHSLGHQHGHQATGTPMQMPSLHPILPQQHHQQHQTHQGHHTLVSPSLSSLITTSRPPSLVPISSQAPLPNGVGVSTFIPPSTSLSASPMISNIPSPIVSNLSQLTPFSSCASSPVVTSATMCSAATVMVQSTHQQGYASTATSLRTSSSSATVSVLPYMSNGFTSNSFKTSPMVNQLIYSASTATTTAALTTTIARALSSTATIQLAATSLMPSLPTSCTVKPLATTATAKVQRPQPQPLPALSLALSSIPVVKLATNVATKQAEQKPEAKIQPENAPVKGRSECNLSPNSNTNGVALTTARMPPATIKSSSPPPLQPIQSYLQGSQSIATPLPAPVSSPTVKSAPPQMASPKSLVLERIQKKNSSHIDVDDAVSSHCNRSRNSVESSKHLLASPTLQISIDDFKCLSDCAKSPILSQPKTIRFPAPRGACTSNARKSDGVCYWDNCEAKYDSSSNLLDHLQILHVNTQMGPFICSWEGCKVYSKPSCSRKWLERHVLSHVCSKPFKCIVEGCGLRFGSQLALQKHVNAHFTNTDTSKESSSKRSTDPPVPKQMRKSGRKLRYRRQPFSARMFDFFDNGIMEGLRHRLLVNGSVTNAQGDMVFKGQSLGRRVNASGEPEALVRWSPLNIIDDEWINVTDNVNITKTVPILKLSPDERVALLDYFKEAYKHHLGDDSSNGSVYRALLNTCGDEHKSACQPKRSRKQQPMRTPS